MRILHTLAFLAIVAGSLMRSVADDAPVMPDRVDVPSMSTSIYVGSVRLEVTPLQRDGETWTSSYSAHVFPWAFWNEHGELRISIPASDVGRLLQGETVEFSGEGRNHKGKTREISGRAQPQGPKGGRMKIRIRADGIELVFNGSYSFPSSTASLR